jgi:hypothetical protein
MPPHYEKCFWSTRTKNIKAKSGLSGYTGLFRRACSSKTEDLATISPH